MDIKNSKEILNDFLDKYGFTSIYKDSCTILGGASDDVLLDSASAVRYLISSALTGKKVIGFFHKLPFIDVGYLLRGECVFVTTSIPETIAVPTIFCRTLDELEPKLTIALKVSLDSKLPVVVVISDNTLNNFAMHKKTPVDVGRSFAYLSPSIFDSKIDLKTMDSAIKTAETILSSVYNKSAFEDNLVSFYDPNYEFFDYLLPKTNMPITKPLKNKEISVLKSEYSALSALFSSCGISAKLICAEEPFVYNVRDFLCPGCPFVAVFANLREKKDVIVFSDIECDGIKKTFNIKDSSLESYLGYVSSALNVETIFVGAASNYKNYYGQMLQNGRVIFLADCDISIDICSNIKHPKKLKLNRNSLFAYSCSSIKKYGRCKVNPKRCKCLLEGGKCDVMEFTKCPAFYIKDNKVGIDAEVCTGCGVCEKICKFGAI